MSERTRFDFDTVTGQYIGPWGGTPFVRSYTSRSDWIQDHTGPGDCSPLWIDKRTVEGGLISGSPRDGSSWDNFPGDGLYNAGLWNHSHLGLASDGSYAAELAARTSPNRPSVDLPVALAELRELPQLVKDVGEYRFSKLRRAFGSSLRFLSKAAKLNLMIQFGVLPIINDAQKLLIFQKYVLQRMKEIEKLEQRGLRRTVRLDSLSTVWEGDFDLQSSNGYVTMRIHKLTTVNVRGHIRWKPSYVPSVELDNRVRSMALQAVLGSRVDFLTAWQLIPWGWLIDWFSNVGSLLLLTRNIIPASITHCVIMKHWYTETRSVSVWCEEGLTASPLTVKHHTKSRFSSYPTLSANLPILTGRQTSILGSLAVLKSR